MSGDSPKPTVIGESGELLAAALGKEQATPSPVCASMATALGDFATLDPVEAQAQMPVVAEHLRTCVVCQEDLALVRAALSQHGNWLALAKAMRGTSSHTLIAAIAGAWHWLSGDSGSVVPLRQEDFALGRRLGDWMLFQQRADILALSRGQETVASLGLAIDFTPGARLQLVVTPEHITSSHREMWRLNFELQVGASIDRVLLELLGETRRSYGVRTVHAGKPVEFQVEPPTKDGYSLLLTWTRPGGREAELKLELPVRMAGGEPHA
jgi:hypothetical protein